ncbi:hypothetical protein HanIR_Chr09g0421451 [Helianthus annuus]|nr:hypothetical protein HanIR_Chr09g0421451 [Helianthus annuus]
MRSKFKTKTTWICFSTYRHHKQCTEGPLLKMKTKLTQQQLWFGWSWQWWLWWWLEVAEVAVVGEDDRSCRFPVTEVVVVLYMKGILSCGGGWRWQWW